MQMDLNILGRRNPLKSRSKPTESKIEEPVKEVEASVKPKSKSSRFTIQLKYASHHEIWFNRIRFVTHTP